MRSRLLSFALGGFFFCGGSVACSAGDGGSSSTDAASGGASTTGGSTASGGVASGGGASGGAASGGSGTGGAASGGATTGDCSSSLVCTDFDSDTVGTLPAGFTAKLDYGNNGDASKVAVSSALAHSGTNSVKVDGTNGLFGLQYTGAGNTFYLRAWLKVEAPATGNPVIVGVGPTPDSEMRMRITKKRTTTHDVVANAAAGDGLSPPNSSGSGACPECVTLPTDWFCFRMYVDKTSETLKMWVGETQAVNLVNNSPWHSSGTWPSSMEPIRIGSTPLEGGGATVYIDDLAIGASEIACE